MTFRLGAIPVRIHAAFFFTTLFLGINDHDPRLMAIWVGVVFVSVLVHELGHALMGKAFGLEPRIDLHGMGGTTSWISGKDIGNGKRIAISLAGPFAGFALGAVVHVAYRAGGDASPLLHSAVRNVVFVNIGWGIFNLLPLLPLDGGNVLRSVLDAVTKGRGDKPARIVSIVFCVALLALAVLWRNLWIGMLAVLFGLSNIRALRDTTQKKVDAAAAQVLEEAHAALERHDGETAITLLKPVLLLDASPELRSGTIHLYGYALLVESRWDELVAFLDKERKAIRPEELARFAHTARELGRIADADRIDAMAALGPPLSEFRA